VTSGNGHVELMHFNRAPQRVVSLVPSVTDSLFQLGAGDSLVGVTDYCPVPMSATKPPSRVGGTRTVDTERVAALKPDLVIANQEENPKDAVEALEESGVQVWVTFPKSPYDALRILHTLTQLFRLPAAAIRIETLERTLDWTARSTPDRRPRVFCPIWFEEQSALGSWWMTFNADTYAGDLLRVCGGDNVFADRERCYPLGADLGAADPEVILLPSEPFAFGEGHVELVRKLLPESNAVRHDRVHRVDGRLITWHGTKMAQALAELPSYFNFGDDKDA